MGGWGWGNLQPLYFEEGVVTRGKNYLTFFNHQDLFIGEPHIEIMFLYSSCY